MAGDFAVRLEHVSKKYCKTLKLSMRYGIADITRNMLALSSNSGNLREKEFWAVEDISLEIKHGEALGIIGPNGSGKTTVLKMINGIFWPDKGRITVRGKVSPLIEVGAGFHPMLTGRENVYVNSAILGMSKRETDRKFDEIVDFADIGDFLDAPVKHYSSGMCVRLGFAIAAHCEPDILLIDEVLAVGDADFRARCSRKIADLTKRCSVVIVSHNLDAIEAMCSKCLVLQGGEMTFLGEVTQALYYYQGLVGKRTGR
jgi:lipopolysaccharide transport system ATP-binding protein